MLGYSDELNASTAARAVRLVALSWAGGLVPLLSAFLPRDSRVIWPWVIVGGVLVLLMTLLSGRQVLAISAGGTSLEPPAPRAMLVENVITYLAVGCLGFGLSGPLGLYRLLFLGPLLLMAVIGNRCMFIISFTCCIGLLVAFTAGSGIEPGLVPGFAISYGCGFLVAALFVRSTSQSALKGMRESERYAEIAAIAARAEDVGRALDEMLPAVGQYLDAAAVSVHDVCTRIVSDEPSHTWPEALALNDEQRADLRIAAVDGRVVINCRWTCLPVSTAGGVRRVLLIGRKAPDVLHNVVYEYALDRVAVQIGVLLQRFDLFERLHDLTRTDSLTELPNRRSLTPRLEQESVSARRTDATFSVAMVDIDFFKHYNDSFGHLAGDELLRAFAAMLRQRMRDTDFIARYGGEEFCAVLPQTDGNDAAVVLNEIHRRCQEIRALRPITFSAGIAEFDGEEAMEDLVDRADKALYRAKISGRNQTHLARPGPRTIELPR